MSLGISETSPLASVLVGVGRLAFWRQSRMAVSRSAAEDAADEAPETADDAPAPALEAEELRSDDVGTLVGVTAPPEVLALDAVEPELQPVRTRVARPAEAASRAGVRVMRFLSGVDRFRSTSYPPPPVS
jgi:hypothetical protein